MENQNVWSDVLKNGLNKKQVECEEVRVKIKFQIELASRLKPGWNILLCLFECSFQDNAEYFKVVFPSQKMLVSAVNLNSIGEKNTLSIQAAEFTLMQSDFLLNKVIRTLVIGFYTTVALFGEQNAKGFNCQRRQ